jgi:hypothetical protein
MTYKIENKIMRLKLKKREMKKKWSAWIEKQIIFFYCLYEYEVP